MVGVDGMAVPVRAKARLVVNRKRSRMFGGVGAILAVTCAVGLLSLGGLHVAKGATPVPGPALDNPQAPGPLQTAVLAGGCFWGTQGVFEHVKGVRRGLAGYSGGAGATAPAGTVSSGGTG